MAPHLALLGRDNIKKCFADGLTPVRIHACSQASHASRTMLAPNLTASNPDHTRYEGVVDTLRALYVSSLARVQPVAALLIA